MCVCAMSVDAFYINVKLVPEEENFFAVEVLSQNEQGGVIKLTLESEFV